MNDQQSKDPYDLETICSLCECSEKVHAIFWSCPILSGEKICIDCCQTGCLKKDIAEKFSKALGKEITLDQVNNFCRDCGKNYATQNEQLAKKLENDSL